MWLLNTRNLELQQIENETDIYGRYAILSHVWVKGEEVSFQDLQQGTGKSKIGYAKVVNTCWRALKKDNLEHVWIDTCCIDKTSSAELSEAINSMYRWYFEAKVCYAYLRDLPDVDFKDSKWFTRGWTLQELIAPRYVEFYNVDWEPIGSKINLLRELAEITQIDVEVLRDRSKRTPVSVAARMAWAAQRQTTRIEDRAYSLMGIFDVNMPMLYGEGAKAFTRLQEEIIRSSTDHSILAWTSWSNSHANQLFSPSPYGFRNAHNIIAWSNSGVDESFLLSNKGLRITLVARENETPDTALFTAILNCRHSSEASTQIGLLLQKQKQVPIVPTRDSRSTICRLAGERQKDGTVTRLRNVERHVLPYTRWANLLVLREPSKAADEAPGLIWTQEIYIKNTVPHLILLEAWPEKNWSEREWKMTQVVTGATEHDRGYLVFGGENGKKMFILACRQEYMPTRAEPRLCLRRHSAAYESGSVFSTLKHTDLQRKASVEFEKGTSVLVAEVRESYLRSSGDLAWTVVLRLDHDASRL